MIKLAALAIACTVSLTAYALADDAEAIGSFQSWSAWKYTGVDGDSCYIYSDAASKEPARLDHGRVGFSVRLLNDGETGTEVNLRAGYEFAPKAIRVAVDGAPFTMIPRGNNAWLRREEREGEFLRALEKGKRMQIEAVSKRGNDTNYSFSLKGVSAAMRKARQTCSSVS